MTSLVSVTPIYLTIRHSGPSPVISPKSRRFVADWVWIILSCMATRGAASWRWNMRCNYQQHLRGLVISNMTAGTQAYLKRTAALKTQLLSPESLAQFNALEAAKRYDDPAYTRIVMEDLYPKMICRLKPWPEPVSRAFRLVNDKIYNQMQGKSEFEVTGNLKDWERWDRLHEIKVKTLTIGSTYDEMDPADMRKMATLMANATSVICPNGSHLDLWDDQAFYFHHLLAFLGSLST